MIFRNVWGVFILLCFNVVYYSLAKNDSNHSMCSGQQLILRPLNLYTFCGILLTKPQTETSPTVSYPEVQEEPYSSFILIMVDPDASPKPNLYWLHWLKTDITFEEVKDGIDAVPIDKVAYRGPNPPSGTHRYQFFLYGEKNKKLKLPPGLQSGKRLFDFVALKEANDLQAISWFQYRVSHEQK